MNIYPLLVRLYPKRFRQEFGFDMCQVFQDQRRAASKENRVLALHLRTFSDLLISIPREHLLEFKIRMNIQSLGRTLTFGRLFVAITLCLIATCVLATILVPKTYMGVARMEITSPAAAGDSQLGVVYDPYQIQTAMEKIKSRKVLDPVIEELALAKWFEREFSPDSPLKTSEAYAILLPMIDIRQSRNTALLEIRVYSHDDRACAEIANKIVEVLGRTSGPNYSTALVDQALPNPRAVRPNVPLNIVLGSAVSLLVALFLAGLIRLLIRAGARPAAAV